MKSGDDFQGYPLLLRMFSVLSTWERVTNYAGCVPKILLIGVSVQITVFVYTGGSKLNDSKKNNNFSDWITQTGASCILLIRRSRGRFDVTESHKLGDLNHRPEIAPLALSTPTGVAYL
jgi:hypothetical protein